LGAGTFCLGLNGLGREANRFPQITSWPGAWSYTGVDVNSSILEVPMELISRLYSKPYINYQLDALTIIYS